MSVKMRTNQLNYFEIKVHLRTIFNHSHADVIIFCSFDFVEDLFELQYVGCSAKRLISPALDEITVDLYTVLFGKI